MRLLSAIALALASVSTVTAADSEESNLFADQNRVTADELATKWNGLLPRLATHDWVAAEFSERRYFPFRNQPVTLTGDLLLSPQHGLSLRYRDVDARTPETIIIDGDGILMRHADGRERSAPNDARATAVQRVLFDVLRLDLPKLGASFDLYAAGDEHAWQLGLLPVANDARRAAQRVTLSGDATSVRELVIDRGNGQRIEISMTDAVFDQPPGSEVLADRFRSDGHAGADAESP